MEFLNFTFKLLKHGTIFLLRVVGILVPAVVGALAATPQHSGSSNEGDQFDDFPDVGDVTHLNWEATYGHTTKR